MSTILVADDDETIRSLCRLVLSDDGHDVLEAEDATACLELARGKQPDLILLDWMMPEIDGMDALRALKEAPGTRDIPVVMLTALDSLSNISLATRHGAEGYVPKPFEVEDLLALVRRFVRTK